MARPDELGDRCKALEQIEAGRKMIPGVPVLARLDGRAFHTYTRGLERPFDTNLTACMRDTTLSLVEMFHAAVGYTQSDEITLAWHVPETAELPFGGKYQKMVSVLAGAASARFARSAYELLPDKRDQIPHFDCRVWQVPSRESAAEVFVWREDDATKNSVTMLASAYYSHRELHGKSSQDKHEMLHIKGVNWNNLLPMHKRGSYFQRRTFERPLTEAEWERIPEGRRPPRDRMYTRSRVEDIEMPPIRRVINRVEVLFVGAAPVVTEVP